MMTSGLTQHRPYWKVGAFIFTASMLFACSFSYALDCVEKSSGQADPPAIPVDSLAIPSNVPRHQSMGVKPHPCHRILRQRTVWAGRCALLLQP